MLDMGFWSRPGCDSVKVFMRRRRMQKGYLSQTNAKSIQPCKQTCSLDSVRRYQKTAESLSNKQTTDLGYMVQ